MVCTAKLPFFLGKSWLNNGMLMYSWGTVSYFQANQHAETCSMLIIWFLVIYFFLIFSLLVLLFSATMPYFPGIAIRIYIYIYSQRWVQINQFCWIPGSKNLWAADFSRWSHVSGSSDMKSCGMVIYIKFVKQITHNNKHNSMGHQSTFTGIQNNVLPIIDETLTV